MKIEDLTIKPGSKKQPPHPLGTHYHAPSRTLFTLGSCECCGGATQEPNAVGTTADSLRGYNVARVSELPPEIYYHDETDTTACTDCNNEKPTPEPRTIADRIRTAFESAEAVIRIDRDTFDLTLSDTTTVRVARVLKDWTPVIQVSLNGYLYDELRIPVAPRPAGSEADDAIGAFNLLTEHHHELKAAKADKALAIARELLG